MAPPALRLRAPSGRLIGFVHICAWNCRPSGEACACAGGCPRALACLCPQCLTTLISLIYSSRDVWRKGDKHMWSNQLCFKGTILFFKAKLSQCRTFREKRHLLIIRWKGSLQCAYLLQSPVWSAYVWLLWFLTLKMVLLLPLLPLFTPQCLILQVQASSFQNAGEKGNELSTYI